MTDTIVYKIGLSESDRRRAAELYEEAFRQKFIPVVKSKDKMTDILEESIMPDYAVVALKGERLVGLAGFHGRSGYFTGGGSTTCLIKKLGLFRGLWALFVFGFIYERNEASGELLMDGIVVDESLRGMGIGTGLIDKLSEYGHEHGYSNIRLDVIDINDRAKQLYERLGFKAVKTDYHEYLHHYLGFYSSTTMVKELKS